MNNENIARKTYVEKILRVRPGISVKELVQILKLDKSGISRSVEELVKKDYVERNPSKEDQRCVAFHLPKM